MSYIGTEPKDIRSFGRTKFDYTASQGQTAFTGADDDGKVLAFTAGQIEVYVNGILMDDSDFTTTGTGTVTLASAANLNDVVNVVSFETNIPDSNYVPASGGTFTGAITLSGNVSGATTFTDQVTFGTSTNLLSNAEFTTNTTGWTATGSTLAIVSNELQLTPGSGVNGFANQQVDNLVVGRSYIASVTVTVDAGSLTRLYIGTSANGNQTVTNSNLGTGTHSFTFTATATTHHFALVVGGGTGQVTRFDNAKLIEANKVTFPAGYGKVDGILAVDRATSNGTIIDIQKDGSSVGTIGANGSNLYIGSPEGTDAYIGFGNNIVRPVTSAGASRDNAIDLGYTGMRFKDLYLSGGAYIGGTGAANKLDDYETGSYNPIYLATGSSGSNSYNYQTGIYTKVGRLCRVWIDMEITSSSGMSGTPAISLPFTADSGADMGSFVPWAIHTNFTNSKFATQWINASTDIMLMYTWTGDTNAGHAVWNLNTTGRISGGVVYQTN
jgi:hypothetical protein